ncbi:hypothetical protein BDL97_11G065400 [Sphagnum fallax]|nr:hypothetical protein BDL97_11G065400 [Sphagnum fallax]
MQICCHNVSLRAQICFQWMIYIPFGLMDQTCARRVYNVEGLHVYTFMGVELWPALVWHVHLNIPSFLTFPHAAVVTPFPVAVCTLELTVVLCSFASSFVLWRRESNRESWSLFQDLTLVIYDCNFLGCRTCCTAKGFQ